MNIISLMPRRLLLQPNCRLLQTSAILQLKEPGYSFKTTRGIYFAKYYGGGGGGERLLGKTNEN